MRRILTASCVVAVLAAVSLTAKADEFYVGDPVMKNDLEIVPHYLLGIEMAPMPKVGSSFKASGKLLAMTAGDGPHYASNVALAGDGDYRLTYHFEPPSKAGFLRHVDKATGVPDWWQPFSQTWTFHFPSKKATD